MPSLSPETNLERATGSFTAATALTAIGAAAADPTVGLLTISAALLPVLANSLAASRQKARFVAALTAIDEDLREHEQELSSISDAQYKLINEAVLALFQTTAEEKMFYLRKVVQGAISMSAMNGQEATVLSRVIRDISAEEANFVCQNFEHQRIRVTDQDHGLSLYPFYLVRPLTPEALVVTGLVSLGILEPIDGVMADVGVFRYSRITGKLVVLLGAVPTR
jgi:hypothetical protein